MGDILYDRIKKLGIDPDKEKIEMLKDYYHLLIKTNQMMNLTSITEYEDVVNKHFVDSLAIVKITHMEDMDNIIDVGTGAGFPGMVIKIMYPELEITLMDSLNKRLQFLELLSDRLSLRKIHIIHSRAEDLARSELHREKYDLCVSRAVANLSVLAEYCLPFVKIRGRFIPYKSSKVCEEVADSKRALYTLGGRITEIKTIKLPDTNIQRTLMIVQKKEHTPSKYPRKPGIIKKSPI